jgi:hypothetical protein
VLEPTSPEQASGSSTPDKRPAGVTAHHLLTSRSRDLALPVEDVANSSAPPNVRNVGLPDAAAARYPLATLKPYTSGRSLALKSSSLVRSVHVRPTPALQQPAQRDASRWRWRARPR